MVKELAGKGHVFTREELDKIFSQVVDKTLGEVDKKSIFERTKKHPKITGIAGDVVEQSILGYPADSNQRPDLFVDGEDIELKTTGIKKSKKDKEHDFEAKEPMSITAVSPDRIIYEEFETSSFWHKLEKMLLVYYHYDSEVTVRAADYANFFIKGYEFHLFDEEEAKRLENDWLIVKNFISSLHKNYENPKQEYPRISSELRKQLMMIDTAPKWPNSPRFRLKRSTVSTMVQRYFGQKFEKLDEDYSSYKELDAQLNFFTAQYKGKNIKEILKLLDIPTKLGKSLDVSKSVTEQIVTRMFGASSKKMGKIELFSELGLVPKTITQTKEGTRTEDTKLFKVDFDEWMDRGKNFEESTLYSDFSEKQMLFIIFEEQRSGDKLLENKFLGFKRIIWEESLIMNEIFLVWNDVRTKIFHNELKETIKLDKDGNPFINKNGEVSTAINFPKSRDFDFFFRGTGADSKDKPIVINGIRMYRQHIWVKGSIILKMLNSNEFI